jgi:hypothetical protein
MDIGEIEKELEAWRRQIPPDALSLLSRIGQLAQRTSAFKGTFPLDRGQLLQIEEQFQILQRDMPILDELYSTVQRTRVVVSELHEEPELNRAVDARIREWSEEWLVLLDHIVRAVGDGKFTSPVLTQVKQIRAWARQRRQALTLLRNIVELDAQADGGGNPVLAGVERTWIDQFCQGRIDEEWLDEARGQFELLRKEFVTPLPSIAKTVQVAEPVEESTGTSVVPFHVISQGLAECRDLAQALRLDAGEIHEFERRRLDLQNDRDDDAVLRLLNDIESFHTSLRERASEEKESRLHVLRLRWKRFQEIYNDDSYDETAVLVYHVEALKPDSTIGLHQFFERVDEALDKIYFLVDSNRPRLAEAIRRTVERSRSLLSELRQQPRTIALDASLTQQEICLPIDRSFPVTAAESFICLDACDAVLSELRAIKQQNAQTQAELATKTDRLKKLASAIGKVGDASETAALSDLLQGIPEPATAAQWLDETVASLNRVERKLDVLLTQVRDRCAADLLKQRKENLNWIRLLTEFAPEADTFSSKELVPQELEPLRVALELEGQYQRKIGVLIASAVQQIAKRCEEVRHQLREHLTAPAFETHPEREKAEELLEGLESLPLLSEAPTRTEFLSVYDALGEAESFIDRLEYARREIPGKLKILEDRFSRLNELNVAAYRGSMAHRIKALLLGMQKAIASGQFEPLIFQLRQTEELIAALETDVERRISAETEELEERLRRAIRTSTDTKFVLQAESALAQLMEEGHLESPTYIVRQRLNRLMSRGI